MLYSISRFTSLQGHSEALAGDAAVSVNRTPPTALQGEKSLPCSGLGVVYLYLDGFQLPIRVLRSCGNTVSRSGRELHPIVLRWGVVRALRRC